MARPSSQSERVPIKPTSRRPFQIIIVGLGLALAGAGAFIATRRNLPEAASNRSPSAGSTPWFEEIAAQSGISFTYSSGHQPDKFYLPEIIGGGPAWIDYDNDGDLDIYFVQGGRILGTPEPHVANKLYRNDSGGRFADVTQATGVSNKGYGQGCTSGDFDNDGWADLYLTNVGRNVLYRNNRDGTFTDVTERAGVAGDSYSTSAAFVDYDHDGDLDLYVANYISWSTHTEINCSTSAGKFDYCKPTHYNAPAPDYLYRNNGDQTFTDVSQLSGISTVPGNSLGVVCTDFNNDGWIDIAVANDVDPNTLWINQRDGTFRERAHELGVAYNGQGLVEAGMGIEAQDVQNDGFFDLFITHFGGELNTLYCNEKGFFDDKTTRFGLSDARPFTGFGTAIIDLNNDALLDIYVANGRVVIGHGEYYRVDPYAEPDQLWQGLTEGGFREVMPRGGTAQLLNHSSRGAAFGDYDNDGRVDIAVVNRDAPAYLLHNITVGGHWIGLDVKNRHGSAAIGARVRIEYDGQSRLRDVRTAYSFCSSNDPRVHFGLGKASRVTNVEILWPDRTVQSFGPFDADRYVTIKQDEK